MGTEQICLVGQCFLCCRYSISKPIPAMTTIAALKATDRTTTMMLKAPNFISKVEAAITIMNIQNMMISFLETKIAPKGFDELRMMDTGYTKVAVQQLSANVKMP